MGVRKLVRCLHLAVNGTWLGAVASSLLLVVVGSPSHPAPYLAAYWLHDNVVVWLAVVVLVTGLYFSLYTPWGLVRRWWILGKWIGLALLGLGIPFVATPAINALAAQADVALATGVSSAGLELLDSRALTVLTIELAVILSLFALSTWRPVRETGWRWEEKRLVRVLAVVLAGVTIGLSIMISLRLERARRQPLEVSSAAGLTDGWYGAKINWLGTRIGVEAEVVQGRISRLRITDQPAGRYPELATLVVPRVESAGSLEVDAISGATTSSRAILTAASRALEVGVRPAE